MAYTQQPVPIQGQVSDPTVSNPDSTIGNLITGKSLEMLIAQLHGKWYTHAYRGNVFHGKTAAAGILIPATAGTAQTFGIWNPQGSGVNVELIAAYYGWVSTAGAIPANIGYDVVTPANALTVTAITASAPANAMMAAGKASKVLFTASAATTTASTLLGTNGMSHLTTIGATTTVCPFILSEVFEGTIIIAPGSAIFPSGTVAPVDKFDIRWVWAELPV
jgi:hypothetical protein